MDALASKVGSGRVNSNVSRHNPPSKLKIYGFTIAIIVGIGGLAVGATGLSGYFHVGALSNMTQLDAIIMMAAGGGSGVILLIIGITGVVKNQPVGRTPIDASRAIAHQDGVFYGPEAWRKWKVEVLDIVPPVPTVDLGKKDKVLLYIPQRIRVNGKEQNLTLKALKEISGAPFDYFSTFIERQFGDTPALGGWVLIDRGVIPESRGKDYATQQRMVEERGCSMPSALEAIVLNLMVFSFTSERLYGREPWIYTRCLEKVDERPVVVGGFGSVGLNVFDSFFNCDVFGVACAQRKL